MSTHAAAELVRTYMCRSPAPTAHEPRQRSPYPAAHPLTSQHVPDAAALMLHSPAAAPQLRAQPAASLPSTPSPAPDQEGTVRYVTGQLGELLASVDARAASHRQVAKRCEMVIDEGPPTLAKFEEEDTDEGAPRAKKRRMTGLTEDQRRERRCAGHTCARHACFCLRRYLHVYT